MSAGSNSLAPAAKQDVSRSQELVRLIAETMGSEEGLWDDESHLGRSWKEQMRSMFEEVLNRTLEDVLTRKLGEVGLVAIDKAPHLARQDTGQVSEYSGKRDVRRWKAGQAVAKHFQPRSQSVMSKLSDEGSQSQTLDSFVPPVPLGNGTELIDTSERRGRRNSDPGYFLPACVPSGEGHFSSTTTDPREKESCSTHDAPAVLVLSPSSAEGIAQPVAQAHAGLTSTNSAFLEFPEEPSYSGLSSESRDNGGPTGVVPHGWDAARTAETNNFVRTSAHTFARASTDNFLRSSTAASSWTAGVLNSMMRSKSEALRTRFTRPAMTASLPARFEKSSMLQLYCATIVLHPRFDWVISIVILSNAASMGVSADYQAKNESAEPKSLVVAEKVFFCLFLAELLLRLNAHRCNFFHGHGWGWNLFDFGVVGSQLIEELLYLMNSGSQTLGFAGVLRLLRLVRVIRLARILRLIRELRLLVSSISTSMKSLIWTMVLMFLMIYSVSLCITQLVSDHRTSVIRAGGFEHPELLLYYGTLSRSMLSLFEAITGGLDWDVLVMPLLEEVHPILALVLVTYVAVMLLAIMNVVTGVFVDSVLASARADKEQFLLNNAKDLFKTVDEEMDWSTFQGKMSNPQMLEFFKGIDVDPSEAKEIFSLIDLDESGSINADEFLNGCVRLQGPSKALETAVLLQEIRGLRKDVFRVEQAMGA